MIYNLFFGVLLIISILISVTFLTLLEQKLLSYIQIRKGPNKVGLIGLLQPFSDAIKLFLKEYTIPLMSNYSVYYIVPTLSLILSLFIWVSVPFVMKFISFKLSFLFMISCMGMGVYGLMISGWASNSNYALLGGLRAIAQVISYEVCMVLIIMSLLMIILSLNLFDFIMFQKYLNFIYLNFLISFIIFIIFLAETNRAPFDFAEGESELVSGFNVEYSSGGFALIFLSEYTMILFLSMIFVLFFIFNSFIYLIVFIKVSLLSFVYVWVRGSYPRFRYDKLMYLTWKVYLPFSLLLLLIIMGLKMSL